MLSVAFARSLKSLEIEPGRYRTLPLRQRRLALCEAIYKTAKLASREIDWYADRSDLRSKQLWDFTPDQIAQHQILVDALIALVCLGESSFIRPLVTYLSFPEPRWAILIDSVLRAVTAGGIRGSTFRLPNEAERSSWRKWAIDHTEVPRIRDYSEILLSDIGVEDIKWRYRYVPDATEYSFLVARNEFLETDWKYYDEQQADFCTHVLYWPLKAYDYSSFAGSVEAFVKKNPLEGNFTTLVACVNDWINELGLPKSTLKHDWLTLVSNKEVSSRTSAILFQILVYPKKDRVLARDFANHLLRDEAGPYTADLHTLTAITDILTQSQSASSVYRVAKALSDIDELPRGSRDTLLGLDPMISMMFLLWISNLSSREIESLCILGAESPSLRHSLLDSIARTFRSNSQTLIKLGAFENSPNPSCQRFALQMKYFYKLRKPFVRDLPRIEQSTSGLVSRYLKLLRTTCRKLLRLESPKRDPSSGNTLS